MRPASARRFLPLVGIVALVAAGCGTTPSASPRAAAPAPAATSTATAAPRQAAATTDPRVIASRVDVPVLCFHQIRNWRASDSSADRGIITPPAVFARQMDWLTRAGFTPIDDDALYAHLTTGAALPRKPILLTFDDGSESQVANAVPVLERHHFPATFFLMTVVFDKPQWITRSQIRQLDKSGITIASHTYDHHSVSDYTGHDFEEQLVAPRTLLSSIVGHPVVDFAYPYGSWRRSSLPHVRAAGYRLAFGLDTKADPSDPLHSYPRLIVPPTWTEQQLLAHIATAARPTSNDAQSGES
jgi:peptidoglycan/xylan/chitin deacetylase (PgdA/CDA1 family)